jgi:hypothetical protein
MSKTYTFKVPPTHEMGSYAGTCYPSARETYKQNALWDYNAARAHGGHPPLRKMPAGTTYARVYEYEIQLFTCYGWECVCSENSRKEALEQVKCYRENQPARYRIKRIAC